MRQQPPKSPSWATQIHILTTSIMNEINTKWKTTSPLLSQPISKSNCHALFMPCPLHQRSMATASGNGCGGWQFGSRLVCSYCLDYSLTFVFKLRNSGALSIFILRYILSEALGLQSSLLLICSYLALTYYFLSI